MNKDALQVLSRDQVRSRNSKCVETWLWFPDRCDGLKLQLQGVHLYTPGSHVRGGFMYMLLCTVDCSSLLVP